MQLDGRGAAHARLMQLAKKIVFEDWGMLEGR
jgi:hypothetical protein